MSIKCSECGEVWDDDAYMCETCGEWFEIVTRERLTVQLPDDLTLEDEDDADEPSAT